MRTKTIAVTEDVWARLKQMMKSEGSKSMNELLPQIISGSADIPHSMYGAHKRMKLKLTQKEHEKITKDRDWDKH